MRYLKIFEEFTENKKNTSVVYMDSNLVIKVPKTLDSTKHISDPQWCTTSASGFYKHNFTANLFRFTFADGYRLRLTWDYNKWDGNYSSGTHWGCGGEVNGVRKSYLYIRPTDELKPFEFSYDKDDGRQEMVDRIKSIPQAAIDKVSEYQRIHKKEKEALKLSIKRDLEKIKIDSITKGEEDKKYKNYYYTVSISYYGKSYDIQCRISKYGISFSTNSFEKYLKNKYTTHEYKLFNMYLSGSVLMYLSINNTKDYRKAVKTMSTEPKSLIKNLKDVFNIEW